MTTKAAARSEIMAREYISTEMKRIFALVMKGLEGKCLEAMMIWCSPNGQVL